MPNPPRYSKRPSELSGTALPGGVGNLQPVEIVDIDPVRQRQPHGDVVLVVELTVRADLGAEDRHLEEVADGGGVDAEEHGDAAVDGKGQLRTSGLQVASQVDEVGHVGDHPASLFAETLEGLEVLADDLALSPAAPGGRAMPSPARP